MYDIKIFLEDNGQFGARINAGKEIVYGIGNNQTELMKNIKDGLEYSFENKIKNESVTKLFSYFNVNNTENICH
ncbi:MAG: hypothetical protein Q8K30_04815 [Candidatus Gracilibacteria bacterium]|nr:hypothetical protein [Candidatus Gracilibacteria bacterium]